MSIEVRIDPVVDSISMPENLKLGLMVAQARKTCAINGCSEEYAGFGFGQSPFHVPSSIVNSLARNANKGHYSNAEGIMELREAICDFNKRYFGLSVSPSRIVVGPGTKDLFFSIFTMINGTVIIPTPSWIGYYPQLKLLKKHYHPFKLKAEDDYKIQPDELDAFLSSLTHENSQHLLILNNPHNPTGAVYSKEELQQIAQVCRRNNVLVLADEIYALTTYQIKDFTSLGTIYPEGTFVTNGLSKDRSAGGYRLGYCILPEQTSNKLTEDFTKIAATFYTNVSTPIQYAAVTAYEPNEEIDEYFLIIREIHRIMGTYVRNEVCKIEGIDVTTPRGAFYFYADFNSLKSRFKEKGIMTSNELGYSMLEHPHHIAVVTGDALMLSPDDYGARFAFVDYDGEQAFKNYKEEPPRSVAEEKIFVENNAPRMVKGIESLKRYIEYIKE